MSAPNIGGKPSVAIYTAPERGIILYRGIVPKDPDTFSISNQDIVEKIEERAREMGITFEQMTAIILFSEVSRLFPLRNFIPIL